MKKILVTLMAVLMLCALTGCGEKQEEKQDTDTSAVVDDNQSDEGQDTVSVEEPSEPYLIMTATLETSVGEAKVEMKLGKNGYYKAAADLGNYGNKEFASGTWAKDGDTITLNDVNGNEYVSTVEGDNVQIVGTWDVGAMIGTEITLLVAKADVESYQ